jgi:hypothetical protein
VSAALAKKVVLAVVDGVKPAMLERAVATGRAPALAATMERGVYVNDCVSAFPSVTPVCAASIATGVRPDRHRIPSMNWWHRQERRYVEYGSSFQASRTFGVVRSLTDTVYNMNGVHLARETPTIFEQLDDAGLRTAGTTYLMYRGRHHHQVSTDTALTKLIGSTVFRNGIEGPKELFYADLFSSRRTGCKGQLGLPGVRDQHTGCVGAYLVEHDLFDFLLFSLPDNDTHSHKNGPFAQVASLAVADRQLERLMHAAGGPDAFFDDHLLIVVTDHSQSQVEAPIPIQDAYADFGVVGPAARSLEGAELAICPGSRSAMLYVLDPDRREDEAPRLEKIARDVEGVDLTMRLAGEEAILGGSRGELRFAPDAAGLLDRRGERWGVEGDLGLLDAEVRDGRIEMPTYPDALARVWAALNCESSGEVLLSAAPGYEFVDWGGAHHVGGGSHGSLHRNDSLGPLLWCGGGPPSRDTRAQWAIHDVVGMVRAHYGLY